MNESLVVTLIGADRPGIVARLAALAAEAGAGWQESRMARLAGQFAGIVLLDVPGKSLGTLERSLGGLESEGLRLNIERGPAAVRTPEPRAVTLELIGHDRQGIVRDISAALARHHVTIDELDTEVESASMSGEPLFRARARVLLPDEKALERVRADLENIADELMVELTVETAPAAAPQRRG
jgi:glycine cleavage system regulatory protein